ncbi:MAG: class I SAM-dependent RNA methyltransferase [Paracoccaceae bacterium]
MSDTDFDIFLVAAPGLEEVLADEARECGFAAVAAEPGGVSLRGGWPEVWRANRELRGATRVLARLGAFRALHLAQLDKRARRFPWADTLRPDIPVAVEATCRASRIYHAGAASQRIARAISEELGAPIAADATVRIKARIDDDLCTISLDTTGASLHKRGHKQAVGKAPMRETLAALMLRECGYRGDEPVLDPMCGSGTFVIEAAEIAAGLAAGRGRGFAFQELATFDARDFAAAGRPAASPPEGLRFYGSDRDAGAVRMSRANAARAGVDAICEFAHRAIADLPRPDGPPGLVMVNPPYGGRIGERKPLFALYATLGTVLKARFSGWRVGLVTSDPGLAKAAGLPFGPASAPIPHGGLKVHLFKTNALT